MSVTATTIKAKFPQFVSLDDSLITLHINTAKELICKSIYTNKYDSAVCYLTAHFLTLIGSSGKGEATKVKTDVMEREYKKGGNGGEGFGSTNYGQQFLAIKNSLLIKVRRPIYGIQC